MYGPQDHPTDVQSLLASIISVLGMTHSDNGKRDTLWYRYIAQTEEAPGSWGHEYVRHLAAELGEEYQSRYSDWHVMHGDGSTKPDGRTYLVERMRDLAIQLAEFFLKHNAEADAVDLLMEMEIIERIVPQVDDKTWARVCQYMVGYVSCSAFDVELNFRCVPLLVPPDDIAFLQTAAEIYAKHDRYPEALGLAIKLNDRRLIRKYFAAPRNPSVALVWRF